MTEELKDMYWAGELNDEQFINRALDIGLPVEEIEGTLGAVRGVDGTR